MAKDYKSSGGRRRGGTRASGARGGSRRKPSPARKKTARRGQHRESAPGWQWMLAGLSIGLLVAAGVYLMDHPPGGARAVSTADPDSAEPVPSAPPEPASAAELDPVEPQFDFYETLPRYEVVVPEEETGLPEPPARGMAQPGTYVLQAGSFRTHEDADRMQATLALQGIESRIQVVRIDDEQTWHRVRIGPVEDLEELDRLRNRLRSAEVDYLMIRVGGQ